LPVKRQRVCNLVANSNVTIPIALVGVYSIIYCFHFSQHFLYFKGINFASSEANSAFLVASFMAVADLVSPPGYYMTYEDFKRGYVVPKEYIDTKQPQSKAEVKSEEELQKDYENLVSQEKVRARERALNSLIKSFGWIVIPLPVFLYYQRRLKQE